ncbi:HU family DNA-binding protein [Streptomyces sp. NPDC059070]|uniref:HU family DNA-binding protein n=1 Tax=Streptomyces sp. NPDC059070 TaxID=3346713 RepID=UPI0036BF6CD4
MQQLTAICAATSNGYRLRVLGESHEDDLLNLPLDWARFRPASARHLLTEHGYAIPSAARTESAVNGWRESPEESRAWFVPVIPTGEAASAASPDIPHGASVNKGFLIEDVATKLGSRSAAAAAVEAVFDSLVRAVVHGNRVRVTGFGSIEPVDRQARTAFNPQTGGRVHVEATRTIRFRPGTSFKALVDGTKELPEGSSAIQKAPKTPRP